MKWLLMKLDFCSLSSGSSGNCYYLGDEYHGILIDAGFSWCSWNHWIPYLCRDKKITVASDLGHICQTAAAYIKAANLLVIESNYDEQMLVNGNYPNYLKARIQSDRGHLGNHQTSAFLAENIGDNISHICLAHLSKNNNTPEIALQTLKQAFSERGINLNGQQRISILNRNMPSDVIRLIE